MHAREQATYSNLSHSPREPEINLLLQRGSLGPLQRDHPAQLMSVVDLIYTEVVGGSSTPRLLSYVGLLDPIYQHVISTVQYLPNRANIGSVLNQHRRGYHREGHVPSYRHIPVWSPF